MSHENPPPPQFLGPGLALSEIQAFVMERYKQWLKIIADLKIKLAIQSAHEEMTHSDFKIGEHFYTATGKWLCTDVGKKVIIAMKAGNESGVGNVSAGIHKPAGRGDQSI